MTPSRNFVRHPFLPVCTPQSRILVLGSMPSPASRRQGFYYGHPQNRFWQVLAALLDAPVPPTVAAKEQFLHVRRIALWDVMQTCRIAGASDATLEPLEPHDIAGLIDALPIEFVFTHGQVAHRLYLHYAQAHAVPAATLLPSTSAANARLNLKDLCQAWQPLKRAVETHSNML